MIIWGTRGLTSTVESGSFNCPSCASVRPYSLKQVRSFFTLYFIPIIPLMVRGRYVECHSCGGTFAEEITAYDPAKEREETNTQLLRVMVLAALVDGEVDADKRAEIKKQYLEIAGLPVSQETLDGEIRMAKEANTTINHFVSSFADSLSPHGKALIIKLAFHTMSAGGDLAQSHLTQLVALRDTLQIPNDQFQELITMLSEPSVEA
jgi:hypothetical protein